MLPTILLARTDCALNPDNALAVLSQVALALLPEEIKSLEDTPR